MKLELQQGGRVQPFGEKEINAEPLILAFSARGQPFRGLHEEDRFTPYQAKIKL